MAKRWNQTNEKVLRKWKKVFQDKFKEFQPDTWMLTAITTNNPPSDMEWEFSLEERVGMAVKCKVCNHVWVTDHGLVKFYYNKPSGQVEGKVLVWLRPQTCPINKDNSCCSSSVVPLIDVYPDEMEAVLSFLIMEIGWKFYEHQYSKYDEAVVENRRILREKRKKKKQIKKAVAISTAPMMRTVANSNIVYPVIVPVALSRSVVPTLPSLVPITPSVVPTQPFVPIQSAQVTKRVTKLRTRWDKSREEVLNQWNIIFESKFSKFTQKCPSDKWFMTMDKVIKNHPLRREKKWQHFLGEKVEAGFICKTCNNVWESKRGWISFWIWQNPTNSEGERIGEVVVHVLGQKCAECPGLSNNKPYSEGDLQGEHIDAVLDALFMEIDYWFYGNESYTDIDEQSIDARLKSSSTPFYAGRGEHRKGSCQACREKVCRQRVPAKFPHFPTPLELANGSVGV